MKRCLFYGLMLIICFGFVLRSFSQDDSNFKVFSAEIIEVRLKDSPHTIRVAISPKYFWQKPVEEDVTIDPRCGFYKEGGKLETVGEIEPGDMVEITYLIDDRGGKVAFNIIDLPKE